MKKRGQATKVSPLPLSTPPRRACKTSPKTYDFDPTVLGVSASKKKAVAPSPFLDPSPPPSRAPATIADVKDLVSSHMDSLKRRLDHCHSEILKEAEASESRIAKRFKMQTQVCMQAADEAEKEYKKVSERITENMEVVKTSYVEFIAEAQSTTSRVCKVVIPELARSLDKAIEDLCGCYGQPSTPA